jgi:hypothetical protein
MTSESWLKISLPAFPLGFTVFGVWFYWGENPLALLPPSIAFFGVVTLFYVFSHLDVPNKRYPLWLMIFTSVLWLVASITSHGLAKFMLSERYIGLRSVIASIDFWYAYVCALFGGGIGLNQFLRLEPQIAASVKQDRAASGS